MIIAMAITTISTMRSISRFCPILFAMLSWTTSHAQDQDVGKVVVVNGSADAIFQTKSRTLKPGDSIRNVETVRTHPNSSVKLLFSDQTSIDLGPNSSLQVKDYALKNGDNRVGTFSLFYGKMRSVITKKVGPQGKVNFKSGGTVMGVRGTEFIVDTAVSNNSPGQSSIVVVSGVVEVAPLSGGAPVALKAGEMITANFSTNSGTSTSSDSGSSSSSSRSNESSNKSTNATGSQVGGEASSDSGSGSGSSGGMQVSKVSTTQMTSMVEGSKTQDNTFTMAVQIQPTSSGGSPMGGGGPSLALNTIGNIVSGAMQAEQNTMQENPMSRSTPEFLNQTPVSVPPVNLLPGGVVNLQVTVQ